MHLRTYQSQTDIQPILQERASELARREVEEVYDTGETMIRFRLGANHYAIPARYARDVQLLGAYTPLPGVPPFIMGLVNVHGRLMTVIDLRPLMELPAIIPDSNAYLIIIHGGSDNLALLADVIHDMTANNLDLSPTPSTASGHNLPWIRGVDRDLSLVIDPPLLFADPRLVINHATAE